MPIQKTEGNTGHGVWKRLYDAHPVSLWGRKLSIKLWSWPYYLCPCDLYPLPLLFNLATFDLYIFWSWSIDLYLDLIPPDTRLKSSFVNFWPWHLPWPLTCDFDLDLDCVLKEVFEIWWFLTCVQTFRSAGPMIQPAGYIQTDTQKRRWQKTYYLFCLYVEGSREQRPP